MDNNRLFFYRVSIELRRWYGKDYFGVLPLDDDSEFADFIMAIDTNRFNRNANAILASLESQEDPNSVEQYAWTDWDCSYERWDDQSTQRDIHDPNGELQGKKVIIFTLWRNVYEQAEQVEQ